MFLGKGKTTPWARQTHWEEKVPSLLTSTYGTEREGEAGNNS